MHGGHLALTYDNEQRGSVGARGFRYIQGGAVLFDPDAVDSFSAIGVAREVAAQFAPTDCNRWFIGTLRLHNEQNHSSVVALKKGRVKTDPSVSWTVGVTRGDLNRGLGGNLKPEPEPHFRLNLAKTYSVRIHLQPGTMPCR